jgi:hypothetical protein
MFPCAKLQFLDTLLCNEVKSARDYATYTMVLIFWKSRIALVTSFYRL